MKFLEKFKSENSLIERYTENKAFVVWAMGLYLDIQDLEDLADNNLTDMSNDHGIDFLRLDEDENTLYLTQSYYTQKSNQSAPSKKASDINTSCAWLINGDIDKFNPAIKSNIYEARNAIFDNKIQKIVLVYLHNCGESTEVSDELDIAKQNLMALLNEKGIEIEILAIQMGNETLERIFQNQVANIIVEENVVCPYCVKYYENSTDWRAAILSISGQWLREIYIKYSGDLFSANYRGFLGHSRQKINTGIKATAEKCSKNFWAFNNGITILTTKIEEKDKGAVLTGMSIINGAQTTGSLGIIPSSVDLSDVFILTRIIECSNPETIGDIVKFNNTQNKITAWDTFSNDPIQTNLKEQFSQLGYEYNIKRGFNNRESLLSIESVIQPLLAISGKYKEANHSKAYIFDSPSLYKEAFEQRGARTVLFASCLNTCLQVIKAENKHLYETGSLSSSEKLLYNILAVIRFKYYILSIIAVSLHKIVSSLAQSQKISFMPVFANAAKYKYDDLVNMLKPIVNLLLPFIVNALGDDFYYKYNDVTSVEEIARAVEINVSSLKTMSSDVRTAIDELESILCNG